MRNRCQLCRERECNGAIAFDDRPGMFQSDEAKTHHLVRVETKRDKRKRLGKVISAIEGGAKSVENGDTIVNK